ncbi:MAG TPA: hypothetical protein VLT36_14580, partial [Candidatus Dormibacteraeota bacterium]|nr:hypothetical protein [Candidatus Dormibacteraeota bacterium]
YLTDSEQRADTNLTSAFCWTYSKMGSGAGKWPPPSLLGGDRLANNSAIQAGLDGFRKANQAAQMNIVREVDLANNLVASASNYQQLEMQWLANPAGSCEFITKDLAAANDTMGKSWVALQAATNFTQWPLTNIAFRYKKLEQNAKYASSDSFKDITSEIPDEYKRQGIIAEILEQVNKFASESAQIVSTNYQPRSTIIAQLDNNYVSPPTNSSTPAYRLRWMLYSNACAIASAPAVASPEVLGDGWKRYGELKVLVDGFRTSLVSYVGPLASVVSNVCDRLASDAEHRSKTDFVSSYAKLVQSNCSEWKLHAQWDTSDVAKARSFFTNVTHDLDPSNCGSLEPPQRQTLEPLRAAITETKRAVLAGIEQDLNRKMGFPVRLSSAQEKTIPELGALRKLVDAIKVELANPVWQSDNNDAFSSLQQSCARYEPLIGMLVSGNGAPTEWELFFVGQPNNSADWAVTSIFRSLKVAFKDQETKTISDLSRVVTTKPVSLGKAGIATGLGLTFQKSDSDPTPPAVQPEPQQNWWLPRFLSFSSEEPVPSNGAWHFRLKLEESKNKTQGFVFFEARPLDPATPLPTKWPK